MGHSSQHRAAPGALDQQRAGERTERQHRRQTNQCCPSRITTVDAMARTSSTEDWRKIFRKLSY